MEAFKKREGGYTPSEKEVSSFKRKATGGTKQNNK